MTTFPEYESHDGLGLAALIRSGEVSAETVLEAAVERIEARDPAVNAVVHKLYERGRESLAAGLPEGPFAGVPYLLKDLYSFLEGVPCGNGSRLFDGYVTPVTAPSIARSLEAGLVLLGKTTTAEFGLTVTTETKACGKTRNPWDLERSVGGSSGGAAAAVAAGMVPLAHASDGGGSIRIPASACGLYGLKPTRARNPSPEGWAGMATHHAVTRSVRDSAALLDATAGPVPGLPYETAPPERPFLEEVGADPGRLKIAVSWSHGPDEVSVAPECRAAVGSAAALFESLGHDVEEAAPELDHEALSWAMIVIVTTNMTATLDLGHPLREGEAVSREDVEHMSWAIAQYGRQYAATDYITAVETVHAVGQSLGRFLTRYDALLSPTTAAPTPPLGHLDPERPDLEELVADITPYVAFTRPFNMSGQPAASLPLYWTDSGLPVGVQLACRFGDEATLLRLSAQAETAQPWFERRPPGLTDA